MQLPHPPLHLLLLLLSLLPAHSKHLKNLLHPSLPPFLAPHSLHRVDAGPWSSFQTLLDAKRGHSRDSLLLLNDYLARFGYMDLDPRRRPIPASSSLFDDRTEVAVKLYQQSFGLLPTGVLDAKTLVFLMRPRCGREDVVNGISLMLHSYDGDNPSLAYPGHAVSHFGQAVARDTYFPVKPIWSSTRRNLTYAFSPTMETSSIPLDQRRRIFADAFRQWATVVPINFTWITDFAAADIKIELASFEHGDQQPFDGVLGILAHAFSPQDGRLHLDSSEYWGAADVVVDGREQLSVDLQSVVTHQIGHLIGLGHSPVNEAIMYPSIWPGEVKRKLQEDDIASAQALYGKNPSFDPDSPLRQLLLTGVQDASGAKGRWQQPWRGALGELPWRISSFTPFPIFFFTIIIRVMGTKVPSRFFFFFSFFFFFIRGLGTIILLPFLLLHSFQEIYL